MHRHVMSNLLFILQGLEDTGWQLLTMNGVQLRIPYPRDPCYELCQDRGATPELFQKRLQNLFRRLFSQKSCSQSEVHISSHTGSSHTSQHSS